MAVSCFSAQTLDDLLREVTDRVRTEGKPINPSKGAAVEVVGSLLELSNPYARLSRTESRGKLFSPLGELCWYLAGSNDLDFIKYYIHDYKEESDDGKTIYGAYGPRLFDWKGLHQLNNITTLLKKKPDSRQAVIQLFDANDIADVRRSVPCTTTLQFLLRGDKLHMFASMRSNDVHKGLPHDIFCFTMLQEIVAKDLSVELGTYKHAVGSLHLYDVDRNTTERFLNEGWQPTIDVAMPPMPKGNPWGAIGTLLDVEKQIRLTRTFDKAILDRVVPYWADLMRLLEVFACKKYKNTERLRLLRHEIFYEVYKVFVDKVIADLKE
jgi:thymidylate synthase